MTFAHYISVVEQQTSNSRLAIHISTKYTLLLPGPSSGFKMTDSASTWLTGIAKLQHGHGLECVPKHMPVKEG